MTDAEAWGPIPGFEGYEASTLGRVRRVKYLKPFEMQDGRRAVGLYHKGHQTRRKIHQLVALAHIGPRPEGKQVCHNNGDASDNRLVNLRYDTPRANAADKKIHGTEPRFENRRNAKLTWAQVDEIRSRYQGRGMGPSQRELAEEYGVHQVLISDITLGRAWREEDRVVSSGTK